MSKEEQLETLKETISSGVIHPDNSLHSHLSKRYNELLEEVGIDN